MWILFLSLLDIQTYIIKIVDFIKLLLLIVPEKCM